MNTMALAFNPITKRKISYGGRVYKSLISQGYTDEQLKYVGEVKSEGLPVNESKQVDENKVIDNKEKIIKIASNVVAEAFYQDRICQACLPASLILSEMLEKYGIKTQLVYGFSLVTLDRKRAARHVWLEYNGKSIDVGGMIFEKFVRERLKYPVNRKISVELPGDVDEVYVDKEL
jgi:hypothetical protein